MATNVELSDVLKIRAAMVEYQDSAYMNIIRQLNDDYKELTSENWGAEFVKNCGHDLAGEIVRNFFNTSDFYISVDQLVKRMLHFSYDNDYNPLAESGKEETIKKNFYANNEIHSTRLDDINKVMAESQEKLFTEERSKDKLDREKKTWRETQKDENGDLHDDLTGNIGESTTRTRNGKEYEVNRLQADHVQSREAAMYNGRYLDEAGVQRLREFYNSDANFQLMLDVANSSKGDVRVYDEAGMDITYKATPKQLADAICSNWEKETPSGKKIEALKENGYLDENGKVTKSVKRELIRNIERSQNGESKVILQNADYKAVGKDSLKYTADSLWKIAAGQILYYAAPPIIFEIKVISLSKTENIDDAIEKLKKAGKRIGEYVFENLKPMFSNIAVNALKNFIKSFMDILINMVKATVKRILKIAKSLVLSTVDAVRILMDKNADSTHKADAVFNLFGVTITTCVIDVIFEFIQAQCHLPEWVLAPLQVLATVVCTNFTMLILKKLDLFDVNYGFKAGQIKKLFAEAELEYDKRFEMAQAAADFSIDEIILAAKKECQEIYENLQEISMYDQSIRGDLTRISDMFSAEVNFDKDWSRFIGMPAQ